MTFNISYSLWAFRHCVYSSCYNISNLQNNSRHYDRLRQMKNKHHLPVMFFATTQLTANMCADLALSDLANSF